MDQKVDIKTAVRELGAAAREAARLMARADTSAKNSALAAIASGIRSDSKKILEANKADVAKAKKDGCDAAFVDRLSLSAKSVEQMAEGVEQVAALEDPVGKTSQRVKRPTAIAAPRMRVPPGLAA